MMGFLNWILAVGLIPAAEIRNLKEDLVNAIGMNIQSENALRIDLVNLTNAVRENTNELRGLNNYLEEIKRNREIQDDIEVDKITVYVCPKCDNTMNHIGVCSKCGHEPESDDDGKADEGSKK